MQIRAFETSDTAAVDRVALAAFAEFEGQYDDWPALSEDIGSMSELADIGEIRVAIAGGEIVGAVAYIGPDGPKADYFDADWPLIRMLVVDPEKRGFGVGRALAEACIQRARGDGCEVIALHTSPMMQAAAKLYQRLGFAKAHDAPPVSGVPSAVYVKRLR